MKVRKAIIPAAGLGTRLLPNTKSIPKEMLPLVDKPVLQYIVEEAVAAGVEEILVITNRGKSSIENYFDYAPDLENRLLADGKEKEARTVREVADMADVFCLLDSWQLVKNILTVDSVTPKCVDGKVADTQRCEVLEEVGAL